MASDTCLHNPTNKGKSGGNTYPSPKGRAYIPYDLKGRESVEFPGSTFVALNLCRASEHTCPVHVRHEGKPAPAGRSHVCTITNCFTTSPSELHHFLQGLSQQLQQRSQAERSREAVSYVYPVHIKPDRKLY